MVDLGRERDLGRFERIVGGESDGEEEHAASVWRCTWTHDRGLPLEQVVSCGSCAATRGWLAAEIEQLLVNAPDGHR